MSISCFKPYQKGASSSAGRAAADNLWDTEPSHYCSLEHAALAQFPGQLLLQPWPGCSLLQSELQLTSGDATESSQCLWAAETNLCNIDPAPAAAPTQDLCNLFSWIYICSVSYCCILYKQLTLWISLKWKRRNSGFPKGQHHLQGTAELRCLKKEWFKTQYFPLMLTDLGVTLIRALWMVDVQPYALLLKSREIKDV